MAEPCDIAEESFTFSSKIRAGTVSKATESFGLGANLARAKVKQKVVEVLVLDDGATMKTVVAVAREAFTLNDAISNVLHGVSRAVEHVTFGDALRTRIEDLAEEALAFDDAASTTGGAKNAARESFVFSDRAGGGGIIVNRASDMVLISAATHQQAFRMISEALVLHSTAIDRQTLHQHALEAFLLDDAGKPYAIKKTQVREAFGLNDAVAQTVEGSNQASEAFYLNDAASGGDPEAGGAWAASTETFAMSRYTHKRIEAVAVIGGVLFVATEDGIFAMTGESDEGEDIEALATSGLVDTAAPVGDQPADPSLKRGSYAYVAYSGGRMRFGIGITQSGVEERYFYEFPERNAGAPTVNRTRIGRGARSRFWRFLIGNVEGDAIRVTDARVPLDPTSRRI